MLRRHLTWFGIFGLVGLAVATTTLISGCVTAVPEEEAQAAQQSTVIAQPAQEEMAPQETYSADLFKNGLRSDDCQKCHQDQPAQIDQDGRKHKYKVACRDCHEEHPPWGTNTIPQCSNCHEGRNHFELPNCLACHSNPHTPLNLTIADVPESTTGCKTCHGDKGEEMQASPSKHAQVNCTHCHPQKHKVIKKCLECHEPHMEKMKFENCLECHKPHSPLNITYADDTPSEFCGACHGDLYKSLTTNPSKHQQLNCAYCHKTKHPTVPKCADCHAGVHSNSILTRFNEDCLKCHANPHDLVI